MKSLGTLLERHYGLTPVEIKAMEGYETSTFRVIAPEGSFVLKQQLYTEGITDRIWLEDRLTRKLQALPYEFPLTVQTLEGHSHIRQNGQIFRLLTYLEGTFLAEASHTDHILQSLGDLLGRMNSKSRELSPASLPQEASHWDLQHMELHRQAVGSVADPRDRALISYFLLQFESEVSPRQYELRKALIHNDANDWNVLTRDGRVSGLIDFGDMTYSWLINELAVGLTYVLPGMEDPLAAAGQVISAYHKQFPLLPAELDVLYYLIAARMCMSLCNSATAARDQPDSEYIRISEAPVRQLLHKWIGISPDRARHVFLQSAGLQTTSPPAPETYLKRRKAVFPPSLSISYDAPIVMRRAAFQFMFDAAGTSYLDAYNNIMLTGHCHPSVVRSTTRVLRRLNTNTRYLYDELLDYSERLLTYFPPELSRVFFVNSGSAATDLALRLSRAYRGKKKILALENGYHGNTVAGMAVSHYKHSPGSAYPDTLLCPMPKVYGGFEDDPSASAYFEAIIGRIMQEHSGEVAAFIAEPIMGCGGQVPLPVGFLPGVYARIRSQGGVCISDEVQVGFGRLGKWNWGYEKYGVVPDMVILGKPMGNGHPIGAVVTTREIAASFDNGPEFFSSFGGNPVSCAAGLAVLDVLESENLRDHAAETGTYLKRCFQELGRAFPLIGDVRGEGLFLGVELIDASGGPATKEARTLKNALRQAHILIGTDGPADNVLKIKPPLPFNRQNCDQLISETSRILKVLGKT